MDLLSRSAAIRGVQRAADGAYETARRIETRRGLARGNKEQQERDEDGAYAWLESPVARHTKPFEFARTGLPQCDAALDHVQRTVAREASKGAENVLEEATMVMLAQGVSTLLEMGQGLVPRSLGMQVHGIGQN